MLFRFCAYGFLKNQRYFEPFLILVFIQLGLSFFWIGVLIAIRELTVNILEVPSGAIADSTGRRAAMIVSFVAYIFSFAIFATSNQWPLLVLAMVFYGIGDSFRTGTHKAMIFEWLRMQGRQEERTRIYGLTRSWSKIGSAVSSVIAACLVVMTDNFQAIFLFAIIPCALNIINFLGYPRALDGDHQKHLSVSHTATQLFRSLRIAGKKRSLRRLIVESMKWDGVFHAVKDYLQPVLAVWVGMTMMNASVLQQLTQEQKTAIAVGAVYFTLFILASWSSRQSHRVLKRAGSETRAANLLWILNFGVYLVLVLADVAGALLIVALTFILLHMLQNFWRPILIGRFDQHSAAAEGATILSIESQAQRLATLVIAPLVGWLIDYVHNQQLVGEFWPIGVIGAGLAATALFSSFRNSRIESSDHGEPTVVKPES